MLCTALIALALLAPPPAPPAAEPADVQLRTLEGMWKARGKEVTSAKVRFKFLRAGDGWLPLTPPQVATAFDGADLTNAVTLAGFVETLRGPVGGQPWSVMEFLQDGKKTREGLVDKIDADLIFDGESVVSVHNAGKQATVTTPALSSRGMIGLGQFRPEPPAGRNFDSVERVGADVKLTAGGFTCLVDAATGLVKSSTEATGQVETRQTRTQRPTKYKGGVTMPGVAATFQYANGTLSYVELVVVEGAEFNAKLPADAFRLDMPAESVIVDARRKPPWVFRTPDAIRDVAGTVRVKNP